MKKNIIKTLMLAGVTCMAMSGCGDFLEIEPKNFVSEDNFWNEKTDIDQMVTGTYVKMQEDAFIRRCIVWGEVRGDNVLAGSECDTKAVDIYRTIKEDLLSTNQFTNWQPFYSVINQCNIIIARSPEVNQKAPAYTYSDMLATQAEMSFIRDLCYFYLVRAFKDVPYYTNAIQSDDEAVPMAATDGDVIVKALIADLQSVVKNALKAYPKNSDSRFNSNCNRVTQSAIYALLADLCLWDGQYEKCAEYADSVIVRKCYEFETNSEYSGLTASSTMPKYFKHPTLDAELARLKISGYPLYPCYVGSTGDGETYGNDFNRIFGMGYDGNSFESIFELAFTHTEGQTNYLSNVAVAELYGNSRSSDYKINNQTIYRGNNFSGFLNAHESVTNDLKTNTLFTEKDCRYYLNVGGDRTAGSGPGTAQANPAKFAYYIRQVVGTGSTAKMFNSFSSVSSGNWIFYRLTDVMLMKAEALIELANQEGPDGETYKERLDNAFALIYTVNRRSIMTSQFSGSASGELKQTAKENSDVPSLRKLCMDERRRELMFEGKRWFDVVRRCHREGNASYAKVIPGKNGGATPASYEGLFWPYNKNELKNNPLLKQKEYYGGGDTDGNYSSTK